MSAFLSNSWSLRRGLLAASAILLAALLWRSAGLAAEFSRERAAAHLYAQGSGQLMVGRYALAAASFRGVLSMMPRSVEVYGALAEAEFRQGHFDAAIAAYRRWMAIYPYMYVSALFREVGLIELRAGRPAEAIADLSRATGLDPSDWQAFHLLGHAYRRLGDIAAARAAWQHVIRLNPEFRPAHEQLRRLDR